MKKFLLSFILFLLPFVAAVVVEVFVLPVDFFTFRVWGGIEGGLIHRSLPGFWYPRMKVAKVEEGDLAHHTPCALKKANYWETDRYGYRKKDNPLSVPRIVIIGDSTPPEAR